LHRAPVHLSLVDRLAVCSVRLAVIVALGWTLRLLYWRWSIFRWFRWWRVYFLWDYFLCRFCH
jgi:hypothetical protein